MALHKIGQAIEHTLQRGHAGAKQGTQHSRVFEQAVHIAAEHVAGRVLKYRLNYQALTRQYRLTLGSLHQNYDTLDEALQALGHVARLHVVDKSALPQGEPLTVAVRLSLDQAQLPKPLQVDALADREWQVEAGILTWQFQPDQQ